jgi:hypothetical protein
LKVYYKIPDSSSQLQNKMMDLLYENVKMRILRAVEPVKAVVDKENGILIIERSGNTDNIEFRYEGFSPAVEIIIRTCISGIKLDKSVKG